MGCTGPAPPSGTPYSTERLRPKLRKLAGYVAGICEMTALGERLDHRGAPVAPRLVFTTMTPLAAAVPYSAAADGPLMMSTLSIVSRIERALSIDRDARRRFPDSPEPSKRIPSTTTSGSLVSERELLPRMRIFGEIRPRRPAPG